MNDKDDKTSGVSRRTGGRQGGGASGGPTRDAGAKPPGRPRRSAREVALDVLACVDAAGAFSGLALNRALEGSGLSRQDAALATELAYGTIQRLNSLDAMLADNVKGWPDRIEPWVRSLLRMSAYQLRWLDRVPAHAAVDEAVRIAKKRGHAGIAGLVNGVLRALIRDGLRIPIRQGAGPAERLALEASYPQWLTARWIAAYGERTAEAMCAAGNEPPRASARVNAIRISRDELLAKLRADGVQAEPSALAADGIVVTGAGNIAGLAAFGEGLLSIQDESSMLVAAAADPRPGMRVLDCCAAPGGKSTHLAERMGDRGEVIASDIHAHKRALIERQAERLGLTCIRTMTADAAELADRIPAASMDVVLLDAPCSGLGVIRRKPEIKWNKSEADIEALSALQGRLLDRVCGLVKPGGTLVYSTCTIAPEENELAVRRFLQAHPEFAPDPDWPAETLRPLREANALPEPFEGMVQLLPQQFGSDGFFIARMKRLRL